MTFHQYLQQKRYSPATIRCYDGYSERFLDWLRNEELQTTSFAYTDLLQFMQHCNNTRATKRTVYNLLGVIRHYCNYLICEGSRTDNPAAGVFIKGLIRKLPTNLLNSDELEELYKQYSIQLNVDSSKKIMLGLLIYQGLTTAELMRLESHHIKLKDGKVLIKGTARTHERLLELKAIQLPELQIYLKANLFKDGPLFTQHKRKDTSERNINNRIKHMFDQLQKLNPKVINAGQIRSSVITEWLRKNHLRQVQYMAGHKYVSSTERYQLNNIDDLQNELLHHHPMS